jgi:hypothetical protein
VFGALGMGVGAVERRTSFAMERCFLEGRG